MKAITLPGTARPTSNIGYGTSGLHGGWSRKGSITLLETAFECGVRHFDTAPLYGLGEAEDVVGQFAARHSGEVSVTTKFGLNAPKSRRLFGIARMVLRPLVSRIPGAKAKLVKAASAVQSMGQGPSIKANRYTVPAMRASLEQSLRKLKLERIDVFLAHEASADDIDDDLRQALDAELTKGTIGAWGLGTGRSALERTSATARGFIVLQFDWSVAAGRSIVQPGSFFITHGAIKNAIPWIESRLARPGFMQLWSSEVDRDLADRAAVIKLLLGAAAAANSEGIVLFTSKTQDHIRSTCSISDADMQAGGKFLALLAAESMDDCT